MAKISACVIVKNEEHNILQWLNNVKQVADEIIVVDTGSVDDTVRIAKAGGAQVFYFDWCNDFSVAKNFAIDRASGDWIIFMDADEYLAEESIHKVKQLIKQYHGNRRVAGFVSMLQNIDRDTKAGLGNAMYQLRIFRRLKNLRYQGKIHESLVFSHSGKEYTMQMTDLLIYHTGYSTGLIKEKLTRNLSLIKKNSAGNFSNKDYYYLMDCYYGLGHYKEAIEAAQKVIASALQVPGDASKPYRVWLDSAVMLGRDMDTRLAICQQAMDKFPAYPEYSIRAGFFAFEKKNYDVAETYLTSGLKLMENDDPMLSVELYNTRKYLPWVYRELGDIAEFRGNGEAALGYYYQALKLEPYHTDTFKKFYKYLAGGEAVDAIDILGTLYDKDQDADYLLPLLAELNAGQVYIYYAQYSHQLPDNVAKYRAAGKHEAAAILLAETLDSIYRISAGDRKSAELLQPLLPEKYKDVALFARAKEKAVGGDKEAARQLMLIIKHPDSAMRSYWQELQVDEEYPLVSIMIPTYNRTRLFAETLKSSVAQTYSNVEIIVCDNSTNEETAELMEGYLDNIRVSYHRNREAKCKEDNFSPFEQLAKGEYLQWLMDDDILEPEKLTKMIQCFKANPDVTLVTSQRGIIDGDGKETDSYTRTDLDSSFFPNGEYSVFNGESMWQALLHCRNFIGEPSATLFRRKDLANHYWQADCRGYKTISDVVMWLELLEKGNCAMFQQPLSWYRRHGEQEGQQMDVILLSRIEWVNILREKKMSKVYKLPEEIYTNTLTVIYNESKDFCELAATASQEMNQRYYAVMEEVRQELKL